MSSRSPRVDKVLETGEGSRLPKRVELSVWKHFSLFLSLALSQPTTPNWATRSHHILHTDHHGEAKACAFWDFIIVASLMREQASWGSKPHEGASLKTLISVRKRRFQLERLLVQLSRHPCNRSEYQMNQNAPFGKMHNKRKNYWLTRLMGQVYKNYPKGAKTSQIARAIENVVKLQNSNIKTRKISTDHWYKLGAA
jgi:hypothetical protein